MINYTVLRSEKLPDGFCILQIRFAVHSIESRRTYFENELIPRGPHIPILTCSLVHDLTIDVGIKVVHS